MKKLFRIVRLLKLKVFRIRDFPEAVAIGLSWGAAVSFTPLLGFHLIICYLGTWLMRGNLIAATVGTIIGNPWTFPFFFYIDYKIGLFFFRESLDNYEFKVQFFIDNFEALFYPTLLGSLPIAFIIWFLTYYITKNLLTKRYEKKNKTRR
mgnify:CR=1 FL=1